MNARAMRKRAVGSALQKRQRPQFVEAKRAAALQKRQRPQFVALARRLTPCDVQVTFHNGNFGRAFFWGPKIYAPYLTTVDDLRIYLHELGHVWDWRQRRHTKPLEPLSEGEFRAESYAFRMMRRAGISLSRESRRAGVAYVGYHVVKDVLHDRIVSAEALAFVGLKGVHRMTIIRAHIKVMKRIDGPMLEGDELPLPRNNWSYWSALLGAVPAATPTKAEMAEIKRYEAEQQADRERARIYAEDENENENEDEDGNLQW